MNEWLANYKMAFGIGWIIAFVILILCILLYIQGTPLTPGVTLGLIGGLALARIL